MMVACGLAWAFRLATREDDVSATFIGVSSNDSSAVWFNVSNRSRTPGVYFHIVQLLQLECGRQIALRSTPWKRAGRIVAVIR